MFELKLTELLSTIGAGLIVIVISVYFFFLTQKLYNPKKHNSNGFFNWFRETLKIEFKQTGYAFVASFLIFAAGTLTEDITDHMADSEESQNEFIRVVKEMRILKREGELRKETLIKSDTSLTGLGHEIFGNLRHFQDSATIKNNFYFTEGTAASYWKKNGRTILNDASKLNNLTNMINGLYYTAKNWCYMKNDPVRGELKDIQNRIDFARSVCLISSVTIVLHIILFMIYYLKEILRGNRRFKVIITANHKTVTQRLVFSPFRTLAILLVVFYLSKKAYEVAEKNFNERAFGYYISNCKFKSLHDSEASQVR